MNSQKTNTMNEPTRLKTDVDDDRTPLENSWESSELRDPPQICHDVGVYLRSYARSRPGATALWCLGVGFVLGWRLKPW